MVFGGVFQNEIEVGSNRKQERGGVRGESMKIIYTTASE